MLAARNRLRRSEEFRRAVRQGVRAAQPTVVAHLWPGLPEPLDASSGMAPRVGFVVGRAVGNAVTRNTVQRRLRHLMRDRLGVLPPGSVLVVRATPQAADASSAALGQQLDAALTEVTNVSTRRSHR